MQLLFQPYQYFYTSFQSEALANLNVLFMMVAAHQSYC